MKGLFSFTVVMVIGIFLLIPSIVFAHCDTLDGPVVKDTKLALEKSDITPVLKWIKPADENEISALFNETIALRAKNPEAKGFADRYFFETVVRVHRAGEGAPYTGLKPAGTDLDPAIEGADKALDSGSVDNLVKLVTGDIAAGIREHFSRAMETRTHANESVALGREYVEAYVQFVHYVERLHLDATGEVSHDEGLKNKVDESIHQH